MNTTTLFGKNLIAGLTCTLVFMVPAYAQQSAQKAPAMAPQLSELSLQSPLAPIAESLLALGGQKIARDEDARAIVEGLATIATNCLALYGAELKAAAKPKQNTDNVEDSSPIVPSRPKAKTQKKQLMDQSDMFTDAYMRVMFVAQQSSAAASSDSIDAMYVAMKQQSQALVNRTSGALLAMRNGNQKQQEIYLDRLSECQRFARSKGTKYESIFTGFLY